MFGKKKKEEKKIIFVMETYESEKDGKRGVLTTYGTRTEIFQCLKCMITGLIINDTLSINDICIAFKEGVEEAEKILKKQKRR